MRATVAAALPLLLAVPVPVPAQTVPTIDTEDASLGTTPAGDGRFHAILGADVRNGDFARGGYDDDAASLDRVPVHVQLGFAWDLHRDGRGRPDLWLIGTSSNGLHAPVPAEQRRPRAWYESNTLVGIAGNAGGGVTLGAAYTVKTSPNGIADTTHEASVTAALDGDRGAAALHPSAAATVRTRGDGGLFTQIGLAPEIALADAATLGFPAVFGVGWNGFYAAGSSAVRYGSAGIAYTRPFDAGGARWRLRAEMLALIRDPTLRALGGLDAETGAVVPLATISITVAM